MNQEEFALIMAKLEQIEKAINASQKTMLNTDEAAEFLGVTKPCIYKLCCTGALAHSKPTNKLSYFRKDDLIAFMEQNRRISNLEAQQIAARINYDLKEKRKK